MSNDIIARAMANKANSSLADIMQYQNIAAVSNMYTFDLSKNMNFAIEITDTVAKTIALSNVPDAANVILSVGIKLKFTNNAAITYPVELMWKDNIIPSYAIGKQYIIALISYDGGATWLGSTIGAW